MPSFKCRNTGKKCRFEVDADTEEQVLEEAVEHMETEHDMETVPPETIENIKKTIIK